MMWILYSSRIWILNSNLLFTSIYVVFSLIWIYCTPCDFTIKASLPVLDGRLPRKVVDWQSTADVGHRCKHRCKQLKEKSEHRRCRFLTVSHPNCSPICLNHSWRDEITQVFKHSMEARTNPTSYAFSVYDDTVTGITSILFPCMSWISVAWNGIQDTSLSALSNPVRMVRTSSHRPGNFRRLQGCFSIDLWLAIFNYG